MSASFPGACGVSPKKTLIDDKLISTPTTINKRATMIEAILSALPCP